MKNWKYTDPSGIFLKDQTLLFYLQYCLCLGVPFFRTFLGFPDFRPIPDSYAKIPAFYANIPCYLGFYT